MGKEVIGVVGAGIMGRGIAQLFLQAGHPVLLYDAVSEAAESASLQISRLIEKLVDKGLVQLTTVERAMNNLTICKDMRELSACDLVIEAVVEKLEIKQSLFRKLDAIVPHEALLASNTSSLLIADIAAGTENPRRLAGLHFFNPVPMMKVAEIIPSVRTTNDTVAALKRLVEGVGHRAVIALDQPGFLVNHAGRAFPTESLKLLEENVADHVSIDTVLREVGGFRMGPFELMDLTGLDVSGKVMTSIYEQFQQDPYFKPSSLIAPRVAAGLLGIKTGDGWYRYKDGKKLVPEQAKKSSKPVNPEEINVWIDPDSSQAKLLKALFIKQNIEIKTIPDHDTILIIQPWGVDATHYCFEKKLDGRRCIAIDPLSKLDKHITLMTTPVTSLAVKDVICFIFAEAGCGITVINDSPGFVVQRVLACIVNIASGIAQRRIAKVADIEDAVKLGLSYPKGPLSWGDEIGGEQILKILEGIYKVTNDPRYRPNLWLRRRVQLGVSLLSEEG